MKLVISEQSIILGKYRDSLANFALDYGSAAPALVHPKSHRVYRHGELHASETPGVQLAGGPRIWPEGDAIIAALPTLLTKQTARQEAAQQAAQQAAEAAQAAQQAAEAAQQAAEAARQAAKAAQAAVQAAPPSAGDGG